MSLSSEGTVPTSDQSKGQPKFPGVCPERWQRETWSRHPQLKTRIHFLKEIIISFPGRFIKSYLTHNVLQKIQKFLCNLRALLAFFPSLFFFFNWAAWIQACFAGFSRSSGVYEGPMWQSSRHSKPPWAPLVTFAVSAPMARLSPGPPCGLLQLFPFLPPCSVPGKCGESAASYFKWRPAREEPISTREFYRWQQLIHGKGTDCLLDGVEKTAHCVEGKTHSPGSSDSSPLCYWRKEGKTESCTGSLTCTD